MSSRSTSLLFGLLFNSFYTLLVSSCTTIFRSSSPLTTPVAFVFIFLGETVGTIPVVPFAWKNWTVRTPSRWVAFLVFGFVINANFISWRAASALIPLGNYAALTGSALLLVPAVHAVLQRRCVGVVDLIGIVGAVVGLTLVTRPSFLFGAANADIPGYAYPLAFSCGVYSISYPFFFGATADAHWSNFLVLRVGSSAVVAAVCVGISGGVAEFSAAPPLPLAAVFLVGLISSVYRLSQQVGCNELESFDPGLAGVMGNIFNGALIPTTALFSAAMFGERVTPVEAVGIGVVFVSIIFVSLSKCWRRNEGDGEGKAGEKGIDGEEAVVEEEKIKLHER